MSYSTYDCIDAGTENCPCYLAVTGDCLTCSRLQGKEFCDCNWKGVCIYNEFIQGQKKVNNPRVEFPAEIKVKKCYLSDLIVYVLKVGKGFAIRAENPGSYVFLRNPESNRFYDLPISILKADVENGTIHVGVKVISAKTKLLLEAKDCLIVRGVYRNGIQGVRHLMPKYAKDQKILFLTKGIGAAPALLAMRALRQSNEVKEIHWIADTEKVSTEFMSDYSDDHGAEYLSLSEASVMKEIEERFKREGYNTVAVMASDYFVEKIEELTKAVLPEANFVCSNNFHICCGEGLCGACVATDESGRDFKMCKCQK